MGCSLVTVSPDCLCRLDVLEDYLTSRGFQFGRIDGSITGAKRQASIDEYNREGSPLFIMVIPLGV